MNNLNKNIKQTVNNIKNDTSEGRDIKIKFSCGFCGVPLDENIDIVDIIPDEYNPNNYNHDVCIDCRMQDESNRMCQVTRDMAIDAGDLSLEGQWIKW